MPTLSWIGKDKVENHHLSVPYRLLNRSYTFGDKESENKIIHGDNLLALKSLLPEYEGRVKCIYIDPPYNTGNENWVYNDNVNDPQIKKWLGEVVGKEGEDLSRHDKWLCMMYPRLKLLKKLLADDGAIFISIDDNEQANLRLICDEIFGAGNFVTQFVLKSKQGKGGTTSKISKEHEYVTCYAKNITNLIFNLIVNKNEGRKENLRQWGQADRREDRPTMFYPIKIGNREIYPIKNDGTEGRWRVSQQTAQELLQDGFLEAIKKNQIWNIYRKFPQGETSIPYGSWLEDNIGITAKGTILIKNIGIDFDYPKPVELLERILKIATDKDSIILDSFAGSGTTAHAVLNLNKQDGGNRKFILIEMMDYAETITAERVKRVIKGYGEGKKKAEGAGGGFSYYELGEPLMNGEFLNEDVGADAIRRYVYFTETKQPLPPSENAEEPYYLGTHLCAAYYFYYEREKITALSWEFLSSVRVKAESYVIYADICALSVEELIAERITFKKIPRDIKRI